MARVAWFEYRRHVLHRRFLATTLGMPLLILASVGLSIWAASRAGGDERPWAVVGAANVDLPADTLPMAEPAAAAALDDGSVAGYAVLGPNGSATVRSAVEVPRPLASTLRARALDAVLDEAPAPLRPTLRDPVEVADVSLDTGLETGSWQEIVLALGLSLGLTVLFAVSVTFATSFLILAVTEEKENRLMEVLATSVSPTTLIGGKVVGLGALSLTQTGVWLASGLAALALAGLLPDSGLWSVVPWRALLLSLPHFGLGYLLYATLMVGIGVAVGQAREAQQVAGFVTMVLMLPFLLFSLIMLRPDSPAAAALSLFPPTAPVAMPLRLGLSPVPAWQWAVGFALLAGTTWLAVVAVGRVFRASMLLYGQRLSLRGVLDALAS